MEGKVGSDTNGKPKSWKTLVKQYSPAVYRARSRTRSDRRQREEAGKPVKSTLMSSARGRWIIGKELEQMKAGFPGEEVEETVDYPKEPSEVLNYQPPSI